MVNYFIHCHACYINKTNDFRNPNIKLFFDTPIDNDSCNSEYIIEFDKDKYNFSENYMSPKLDYILSFKDETYSSSKSSFKMLGIFDDNYNRVEIKNITNGLFNDILLSDLLEFLVNKNKNIRHNIYCGFCRNPCDNSTSIPLAQPLEYGKENESEYEDLYDLEWDIDEDLNFDQNVFPKGGKFNKTNKKRNKYRKKQIKTIKRKSKKRPSKRRYSY
jgi:hypothetical protein